MADSKPLKADQVIGTLPAGGTIGQVPAKVDGTDYNYAWTDVVGGGGSGGDVVLGSLVTDDYDDFRLSSGSLPDMEGNRVHTLRSIGKEVSITKVVMEVFVDSGTYTLEIDVETYTADAISSPTSGSVGQVTWDLSSNPYVLAAGAIANFNVTFPSSQRVYLLDSNTEYDDPALDEFLHMETGDSNAPLFIGSIEYSTPEPRLLASNNLDDLDDTAVARTNLGVAFDQTAVKLADTDRTTSLPTDDPELSIPIEAGKSYRVECFILISGHASGDSKRGLNIEGAGNTITWMIPDRGTTTYVDGDLFSEGLATGGGPYASTMVGTISVAASDGTVALSWAQAADFATPTTMHAGSHLVVTEL